MTFSYIPWLKFACVAGMVPVALAQQPDFVTQILPIGATAFDQIIARITTNQTCQIDPKTLRIKQENATIRIDKKAIPGCIFVGGPVVTEVALGKLPAGTFNLSVYANSFSPNPTTPPTLVATAQFTVGDISDTKTSPFPLVDYTDHWWNPQESGWGLSIMQHPSDRLFAVWFVYDPASQPVWYTLQPGEWTTPKSYAGPVYKTTGPYYGGLFNPGQVGVTQVGSGTLTFTDYTTGTFSYTVEGVAGSKPITRLPF